MLKDYYLLTLNKSNDGTYVGYTYVVNDDQFTVKQVMPWIDGIIGVQPAAAIIEAYSRRNLPVVPNLLRMFVMEQKNWRMSIADMIARNKRFNPKWKDYEKDIEKYLSLM